MNGIKPALIRISSRTLVMLMTGLSSAFADNDFIVYSPSITEGVSEVEIRGYQYQDANPGLNSASGSNIAIAHAFTEWWKPELYVGEFNKSPGANNRLSGYELENTFQLADPGEYWADIGLLAAYMYTKTPGAADHVELGLLLEKRMGRALHRLNYIWEQSLGNGNSGRKYPSRISYSSSFKLGDLFMPGIEMYYHANDNDFQVGPVINGELKVAARSDLEYSVGMIYGTNSQSASKTLLARLTFEYY